MRLRLFVALLAACVASVVLAQPSPEASNVPTVTRLVKIFSDLERGLVDKMHAKDASALDAVLDPAFEMRIGSAPGAPVPRDAWIRDVRKSAASPRIEQMAVHDFGDVAVVSFREGFPASGGKQRDHFVVDCWRRDGDAWKLVVRYLSDASASGVAGAAAGGTIEKRY